jgi:predicted transcriptional regulator
MADETAALTSKIVTAYLKGNSLAAAELSGLIQTVHSALAQVNSPAPLAAVAQQPAVPIKKSVTPEAVYCLDCGKPQKMLKRHLGTAHDLTVDDYRAKWNLPSDYPVVAPAYAQKRSQLALNSGLGRSRKTGDSPEAASSLENSTSKPPHQYPPSRWSRPND